MGNEARKTTQYSWRNITMAMTINTNVASLNAQRNLVKTQNSLTKSLERLSSGLRINSAKDDAAGLAISSRFSAQVRGLDQSVRNANDGISLLQTSEGAMQEVTSLLQRMREIAVQASNDTYSVSDRASLQGEMDQLYSEIDRIAGATQFNGIGLLDGTGGTRHFQIGANSGQTISVALKSVKSQDLNLNGYSALGELNSGRVTTSVGTAGLTINNVAITTATATNGTAQDAAININAFTSQTGVSAAAYNTYTGVGGLSGITSGALKINDVNISASGSMEELVKNINRDANDVTATLNKDGSITLSNDTGKDIKVDVSTETKTGFTTGTYSGYLSLSDDDGEAIEVEATTTAALLGNWGLNESTGSGSVTGGTVSTVALAEGDLVINGVTVGASTGSSAGDKAVAINAVAGETGVTASALTEQKFSIDMDNVGTGTNFAASNLTINGSQLDLSATTLDTLDEVVSLINGLGNGVRATVEDTTGKLVLTSASGLDIKILDDAGVFGTASTSTTTYTGEISLTSDTGADVIISGSTTATIAKAGFVEQGGSSDAVGSGLSVETRANANNAIDRIDDALNQVADNRGELGAVQNRLDSTISNLMNVSENLSAANGRILDADFAAETANMTKAQILAQAGVAMLAQAKQLPQQVMQLLQ